MRHVKHFQESQISPRAATIKKSPAAIAVATASSHSIDSSRNGGKPVSSPKVQSSSGQMPIPTSPPHRSGAKPSVRYKWTNGGTVKENMDMLHMVTEKPMEMPTTVMAPMTSLAPPGASPRFPIVPLTTASVNSSSSSAAMAASELPDIQRNKYKFSCQSLDGSLHSKTADTNRTHAEQLIYKFNAGHDRKVAFYKKYRSPNPADDDYDAFADTARGPFDLQRPVTEIDFQNVTDADLFESHYAEILTLFTDDSFVKQLSVGGEIDKELLRVRSMNILKSGGTVLDGGANAMGAVLSRRRSSLRTLTKLATATSSTSLAPVVPSGEGESPSPSHLQKQRSNKIPDDVAAQAKNALYKLFSDQSKTLGISSDDEKPTSFND